MSNHAQCPNCACTDDGTNIYKCDDCGRVFCYECKGTSLHEYIGNVFGATCPGCDELAGKIGEVSSGGDDDSDNDDSDDDEKSDDDD